MDRTKPFYEAVSICAPDIRRALTGLETKYMEQTTEIRLRADEPAVIVGSYGSRFVTPDGTVTVKKNEGVYIPVSAVTDTFNRLCGYSIHTHQTSIVNGYITMRGGHRAGISGTAVKDSDGGIQSIKHISCINIRIARECHGAADEIMKRVFANGICSLIVAGPPGSGKTTLLRDTARQLSSVGEKSVKVSVIDEREELAAVYDGVRQFDLGDNTDVLDSYPKAQAISLATRTLSPDVIICDEVSEKAELCAITSGANSGVRFILSVHAADYKEIIKRKQIEQLLMTYGFDKIVLLDKNGLCRISEIFDAGEILDEICRDRACSGIGEHDGDICVPPAADKIIYC